MEIQSSVCLKILTEKNWALRHEPWHESLSGRKSHRPVFEEILSFIDDHPGEVQHYIIRAIDRFTRGGDLTYDNMKYQLSKRGVAMVDSYGIIQPVINTLGHTGFEYPWSMQSPSEISEKVLSTVAKQEVTTILTRMIGEEIRLASQGYSVRAPEDGYINSKVTIDGNKKKTVKISDPKRAKFLIMSYDMRASGQYTDKEIVDRLNAMGYRTKKYTKWDKNHQKPIGQTGGAS